MWLANPNVHFQTSVSLREACDVRQITTIQQQQQQSTWPNIEDYTGFDDQSLSLCQHSATAIIVDCCIRHTLYPTIPGSSLFTEYLIRN